MSGPLKLALRTLAEQRQISIGAAVSIAPFHNDERYRALLAREFNMVTAENAMKFDALHPQPSQYTFHDADLLADFAHQHKMHVRGHTLVWHRGLPDWLARGHYTRNDVLAILHDHIHTVVSHFRGRVSAWDVVNEAIDDDSSMMPSFWLDTIGPEYIELAFRWAHEADPRARLFYNEWGVEGMHAKSTVVYHLLQNLLHRGVPIHGMGFQMHVGLGTPDMVGPLPPYAAIAANMQRFAALGLELHITEMDVQIADGQGTYEERLAEQASVYQNILITALAVPSFTALVQWGVTDTYSWIPLVTGTPDAPLLFDTVYQPKPANDALVDALTQA